MTDVQFDFRAIGLILRERDGVRGLLVHSFTADASLPWRFPGGGVDHEESIESGLLRESKEEAGLEGLSIIRKLGVQRYYKTFSRRYVERHDFLLVAGDDLPDYWEQTVQGRGKNGGEVFLFRWISQELVYRVDSDYQKFLDSKQFPEFFGNESIL